MNSLEDIPVLLLNEQRKLQYEKLNFLGKLIKSSAMIHNH